MANRSTRRQFLSDNFSVATSFAVGAALGGLGHRLALGHPPQRKRALVATKDETTGLPLLRLPEGFRYRTYGWSGDLMEDGIRVPPWHDGMGVIAADGDHLTLCRNHEVRESGPSLAIAGAEPYDARAGGGCTNLIFNTRRGEWTKSWVSLSGTSRNCAGGVTPWGTWLTCEETVLGPGDTDRYDNDAVRDFKKTHGWIFEVQANGTSHATPIEAMGRFVHEAIAIDRDTGIVYETEDRETSGFYRFVPNEKENLSAGGELSIAEVIGQPDLRGGFKAGAEFDVRWHPIPNPQRAHSPRSDPPDELGVFRQGKAAGGSTFARLEGCWFGDGLVYFDATSGGAAHAGQIWKFDPSKQTLTLLFESPSKPTLNMPDNLCVSPRGGILLCEDNDYGANECPQRIFGLSGDGKLSLFAENNVRLRGEHNGFTGDFRTKEWAGATFSPDGNWLFVNIQTPGITFAITGPWHDTVL